MRLVDCKPTQHRLTLAKVAGLVTVAELASLPLSSRGSRGGDTTEGAL